MADVTLKCSGCDKSIQLDEKMESAFCVHCGQKIVIKKTIEKDTVKKATVENIFRENVEQTDDISKTKLSFLNAAWNVIIKHFRNIIGKIRTLTSEERVENNIRENMKQTDDILKTKLSFWNVALNVIRDYFRNIIGKIRTLTPEESKVFYKYRVCRKFCVNGQT